MHYEFFISRSSRVIYLQSFITFLILPTFFYTFNIYFQFDVLYKQYVKSNKLPRNIINRLNNF